MLRHHRPELEGNPWVKGMNTMRKAIFLLALILVLSLAACGGDSAPSGEADSAPESEAAVGDAAAGEKVYNEAAPACITCHSLEPGKSGVGPSLATIGADAGSRVSGQSAQDYVRESIVDPNAFVVDGWAANLMTGTYGSQLSEEQIADLVAYLLSLK
jgi:mono/diheme cytochrome c family protein